MKNILITILVISAVACVKLNVGSQVVLQGQLALDCVGAQGGVTYDVQNLPRGVSLQNDRLVVLDNSRVSSGFYPVKIRVQDSTGATDERVVVVSVRAQGGLNTVEVATNLGLANAARTVTLSEQTRPNVRSDGAAAAAAPAIAAVPVELPQPDAGVSAFLDSIQVPAASYTPGSAAGSAAGAAPSDASYPTIKFPTGGNPDVPNFTPTEIATSRAQRTPATRNPITADDVKAKVTFDRHMNAARALANLLAIVKQAIANKNAAQDEVNNRQKFYNDALNKQRDAQLFVTKSEGDIARVRQGITQLLDSIAAFQKKTTELRNQLKDINAQRDAANDGAKAAQAKLDDINYQLNSANKNLADNNDLKNTREKECANYDGEIRNAENDKYTKTNDADAVGRRIPDAKYRVASGTQRVNDLTAQLEAARSDLVNAQKELNDLTNQQAALNAAVNDLNKRVDDLRARKAKCAEELATIDARVQAAKNSVADLAQKKQKVNDELQALNDKINAYNTQINSFPTQFRDIDVQVAQLEKNLAYLRSQLPIFQRVLNDAYVAGNSANDAVKAARDNLDAATKRFNGENKIAEEATRNIELARVEKEQADAAVEALLRDGAGVLPYATAPAPSNNVPTPAPDANGAVLIKSWSDFVASGFGPAVKPYFIGDLKTLFPAQLPGQAEQPAVEVGADACAADNLRAISGFVVGVAPNNIKVLADGGNSFNISYAGCTKALANKPNYNIAVGDIIVIKGVPAESHNFMATQVACLATQ